MTQDEVKALFDYDPIKGPPKREPLTPQQISEGNQSMFNATRDAFIKGVKFAEDMQGIGGGE
jgi:hypothetical protein